MAAIQRRESHQALLPPSDVLPSFPYSHHTKNQDLALLSGPHSLRSKRATRTLYTPLSPGKLPSPTPSRKTTKPRSNNFMRSPIPSTQTTSRMQTKGFTVPMKYGSGLSSAVGWRHKHRSGDLPIKSSTYKKTARPSSTSGRKRMRP